MINKAWYQMKIKASKDDVDAIDLVKHCEPFLERMVCIIEVNPTTEGYIWPDGTIAIRGYNESGFRYAKRYLESQGFIIVSEKVNK